MIEAKVVDGYCDSPFPRHNGLIRGRNSLLFICGVLCIYEAARERKRIPCLRGVLFSAQNHILDESHSSNTQPRARPHLALIQMLLQMTRKQLG